MLCSGKVMLCYKGYARIQHFLKNKPNQQTLGTFLRSIARGLDGLISSPVVDSLLRI